MFEFFSQYVKQGSQQRVQRQTPKIVLLICGFLLSFGALAEKELLLEDGSRIRGEVVSMDNGVYEIRTKSMGTIKLGSHQVKSISTLSDGSTVNSSAPLPVTTGLSQSAFQSLQSSMTNNAAIMSTIMELQNDPQMKAVLADPAVMRAIQNFDLEALAQNPKIKALMNNSKVRRIQGAAQ